ncbi:uncharacterized protein LOC116852838 [Odontomachus brunneus]|uniref:uncharacterized protein LOC116852838 n=1 Tax=Odontomachus brunneus TaxID=486640 RepID=UPI0013F19766|nr:uncharacterized protein LOC116852838 [Odontomachus brunneus]
MLLWDIEIKYAPLVKYLEVYLDPKLNWKQHLEMKRTKFYAAFWACRRAMGKTWGLKPKIALWLYKAVLLPRLTYAAVVWKSRVEKVEARNLLRSLQGNYLRALAGVMRTTPTEALEVALCVPPLDRIIICMARLTAYRLKCQGEWRGGGRQIGLELLQESPFTLRQDRIPKKYQLNRNFKVQIPTRDEWKTIRLPIHPNTDIWNFKVQIPTRDEWKTIRLPIHPNTDICRAALGALEGTTTESSVVWDCKQALNKLGETNKVTIIWIPGHRGLHGNEVADGLAKLGTLEDPVEQEMGIPFAVGKEYIKKSLEKEHLDSWKRGQGCRRAKLLMEKPSKSRARELLTMNKKKLRLAINLLTGHMALRAHLYNLKMAEQKNCRLCGEEEEDSIHILCRCPLLAIRRYRSWGQMFSEPKDLKEMRINKLCGLVNNTGLDQ